MLIKGGLHLERLAAIAAVAVDKTGTLTHGLLSVVDVRPIDGVEAGTVLATAAAVAARSPHPVDRAIAAHARHAGAATLEAMAVQAMPGLGIAAQVGGVAVELGSPRHFASRGWLTDALEAQVAAATARGLQVVLVARDAQAIGLVTLGDELKTHAREAIAELRAAGRPPRRHAQRRSRAGGRRSGRGERRRHRRRRAAAATRRSRSSTTSPRGSGRWR